MKTKRRTLAPVSFILVLVLCATLFTGTAFAGYTADENGVAEVTSFEDFKAAAADEAVTTIAVSGDIEITEDVSVTDKYIVINAGCIFTVAPDATLTHTSEDPAAGGFKFDDIDPASLDTFVHLAETEVCFMVFRNDDGAWYRKICGNDVALANAAEVPEGYYAQSMVLNGDVVIDREISIPNIFVYPDSEGRCSLTINKGIALDANLVVDGEIKDLNDESTLPFNDVKDADWFYEYVLYVYHNELMNGTGEGVFNPKGSVNRAMIWTILARLEGADLEGGDTWYAKAQDWAMEAGVSDGTNTTGAITREQFVTMLYRFIGEPETAGTLDGVADADSVSAYAETAVKWAAENGILEGNELDQLRPTAGASRAEAAAIIMRFCEL